MKTAFPLAAIAAWYQACFVNGKLATTFHGLYLPAMNTESSLGSTIVLRTSFLVLLSILGRVIERA